MTAAERNAAYEASIAAWCSRIAPVLADVPASRALALAVVGLLLRLLAPTKGSMPCDIFEALQKLHRSALNGSLEDVRGAAWFEGGKAAQRRFTWLETIASCLCRACEDEGLLTCGDQGKAWCANCDGQGGFRDPAPDAPYPSPSTRCDACRGSGWQPSGPVAPPLLALLLHDAHSLLTELHSAPEELAKLVHEHLRAFRMPCGHSGMVAVAGGCGTYDERGSPRPRAHDWPCITQAATD